VTVASGRSPSGQATRASTEPQAGLGHSASVLNAFTPGPWLDNLHAGEKRDGGRFYVHVLAKAAGVVPIACVPTGVEGYGREEGRANARLIATAPELYGALEAFNIEERNIVSGTADSLTLRVSLDTIRKAAAALAKARGEA
jgi:hypothetical protein